MPGGRVRAGRWQVAVGRPCRGGGWAAELPSRHTGKEGAARQDVGWWKCGLRRLLGARARQWRCAAGLRGARRSHCARPRSGRTNTEFRYNSGRLGGRIDKEYRAAERAARFGRPWTSKGCRPWSSPAVRPEDAAVEQCTGQSQLRRLRRGLSEGPGSRVGPGAKALCARQTTPPGPNRKHGQRAWRATWHNLTCVT